MLKPMVPGIYSVTVNCVHLFMQFWYPIQEPVAKIFGCLSKEMEKLIVSFVNME